MPTCDEDSPQLRRNLTQVLSEIIREAEGRADPTLASTKHWHSHLMKTWPCPTLGTWPVPQETRSRKVQVRVGAHYGVNAAKVAEELAHFEKKLHALVAELDTMLPAGQEPNADQLAAIVDLCAWVHAERVRIHPLPTATAARRDSGPTALLCVMVSRHLFGCDHGPIPAMQRPEPKRCRETGNRLQSSFAGCWTAS